LLENAQLQVAAVSFATRHGFGTAEGLQPRVEAARRTLKFARALGAGLVVCNIGRVPPETDAPAFTLLKQVFTELGAYGQHVGAMIAAQTGSEPGADLARLIAALPAGSLCVALNPGHLIANGYVPLDAVASLHDQIRYVIAHDAVRDAAAGRARDVELGRGAVDFPAILAALEDCDYRGFFAVRQTLGRDPLQEIARAISFLRSL